MAKTSPTSSGLTGISIYNLENGPCPAEFHPRVGLESHDLGFGGSENGRKASWVFVDRCWSIVWRNLGKTKIGDTTMN